MTVTLGQRVRVANTVRDEIRALQDTRDSALCYQSHYVLEKMERLARLVRKLEKSRRRGLSLAFRRVQLQLKMRLRDFQQVVWYSTVSRI